ncbi:MAG: hypothetical protein IPJ65_27835 [Archangiaceae bacterium]|nr:hypothetical protein [Archangiaceae bacterium]
MTCGAVLVVGLACGGLDNRPLEVGVVHGTLSDCDADAVVGVVGDAATRAVADGSCAFRLEGVEPGVRQLYLATTAKKVTLVEVEVQAAKVSELGEVVGRPGAFMRVEISGDGGDLDGTVTAPDLPLTVTALGRSGMARIGPFPQGCFKLEVSVKRLGQKMLDACVTEGEEKSVAVVF